MKRLLLLVFALGCLSLPALATTYYVDNCVTPGSDSNNGTSPSTAWLTIAHVDAQSFNPGDSVLFQRTCTWREQLTVPTSGSSGSPITFGAYGSGALPILDGANVFSSWTTVLPTAATPIWSPGTGSYGGTQTGSATCATSGEYMCYSRDGVTTPVTNGSGGCTAGTLYSGSFSITTTETDEAVCNASGYQQSAQANQTVTISGPWTPASPTTSGSKSALMWFKADSIGTCSTTAVSSWADSTGNGHTATQGTGGNQPTCDASQINSLPAVYFNSASSQYMVIASPPTLSNATIFIVFKDYFSDNTFLGGASATTGGLQYYLSSQKQCMQGSYDGSIGCGTNTGLDQNSWFQTAATFTGGTSYAFYRYSGSATTSDGGSTTATTISGPTAQLGCDHGTGSCITAYIAEIVVYNSVLSATDITQVQGYLHGRYGL